MEIGIGDLKVDDMYIFTEVGAMGPIADYLVIYRGMGTRYGMNVLNVDVLYVRQLDPLGLWINYENIDNQFFENIGTLGLPTFYVDHYSENYRIYSFSGFSNFKNITADIHPHILNFLGGRTIKRKNKRKRKNLRSKINYNKYYNKYNSKK